MIDIVSNEDTLDMGVYDTQTPRASNILATQLGALEYVPSDFGIDLKYFLSEDFRFQDESFKSYLVQALANQGINVSAVIEQINALYTQYTFKLAAEATSGGLVAR